MEERVEFVSTVKGFTAVKKFKNDSDKKIEDVIQFLTSVQITTNNNIRDGLEKLIDIKQFNEQTNHLMDLEMPEFFTQLYNSKTKKIITSLFPSHFDKKLKDAFLEAYQVYLMENYFLQNNKVIGYHQILFPKLKKLKKAIKG